MASGVGRPAHNQPWTKSCRSVSGQFLVAADNHRGGAAPAPGNPRH